MFPPVKVRSPPAPPVLRFPPVILPVALTSPDTDKFAKVPSVVKLEYNTLLDNVSPIKELAQADVAAIPVN